MRTTVDIPDDLFRRTKARAALDGVKLKALITRYIELGLRNDIPGRQSGPARKRSPLPVIPAATTGKPIPALSPQELAEIELEEDIAKQRRSTGR